MKISIFIKITIVTGDYLVFLLFRYDFFCLRFRLYLFKEKSNWAEILTSEVDWLVLFSLSRKITIYKINCSFWPFTFLHCFLLFSIILSAENKGLLTIIVKLFFWKAVSLKYLKTLFYVLVWQKSLIGTKVCINMKWWWPLSGLGNSLVTPAFKLQQPRTEQSL